MTGPSVIQETVALTEKVKAISESLLSANAQDGLRLNQQEEKVNVEGNLTFYRKCVEDAVKLVESGAMKLTLAVDSVQPGPEAESLCAAFLKPYEQFATFSFLLIHDQGLCDDLRQQWKSYCRSLCEASTTFLQYVSQGNSQAAVRSTGIISSIKKSLAEIPSTNRESIKRKCMKVVPVVKDIAQEFNELVKDAIASGMDQVTIDTSQSNSVANMKGDSQDEDWDDFDNFEDEDMTSDEAVVVQSALDCLELVKKVIVNSGKAIGGVPEDHMSSSQTPSPIPFINWLNEVDNKLHDATTSLNDFGAELYPSLDYEALKLQAIVLENRVKSLCTFVAEQLDKSVNEDQDTTVVEACREMKTKLNGTLVELEAKMQDFVSTCASKV